VVGTFCHRENEAKEGSEREGERFLDIPNRIKIPSKKRGGKKSAGAKKRGKKKGKDKEEASFFLISGKKNTKKGKTGRTEKETVGRRNP